MSKFAAPTTRTSRAKSNAIVLTLAAAIATASGLSLWQIVRQNDNSPATSNSKPVSSDATAPTSPSSQSTVPDNNVRDPLNRFSFFLTGSPVVNFSELDQGKLGTRLIDTTDVDGRKISVNFIDDPGAARATADDIQTVMFEMLGDSAEVDDVSSSDLIAKQSVYFQSGVTNFIRCWAHAAASGATNSTGYWCLRASGQSLNQTDFEQITSTVKFTN